MLISKKPSIKILWFSLIVLFISMLIYSTSSFGFSTHPSTTSIFRTPEKAQAFTSEPITITTRFYNNESISLRGFYYVDNIPEGLTVNTIRIAVDGNDVCNYIEETGSVGDIFAKSIPYRWILETPPILSENNPIRPGSVLEIVYSIMSDREGLFDLYKSHWVGYYQDANEKERSAFGFNEDPNIFSVSWAKAPPVDINPDTDDDGMPDRWENDNELNPNSPADALEDPDNDGYNNLEEYKGNTSPKDSSIHPVRPYVLENECYPHDGQGIEADSIRVTLDTSIVIRIKDDEGIDKNSIFMTVRGEDVSDHIRLKQIKKGDSTEYWVIYSPLTSFNFGEKVTVILEAKDIKGIAMKAYTYCFQIESENEHNEAAANTPLYIVDENYDPNQYVCFADPNTEIVGAKIIYDPNEPIAPRFGPFGGIPELINSVGLPIALETPVFFQKPITIFIPCPGIDDVSKLDVFCFNPAVGWIKIEDNDGLVVPGTRINHNDTFPPTIEIQVKYLTALQAGLIDNINDFSGDSGTTSGGCFINTTPDLN